MFSNLIALEKNLHSMQHQKLRVGWNFNCGKLWPNHWILCQPESVSNKYFFIKTWYISFSQIRQHIEINYRTEIIVLDHHGWWLCRSLICTCTELGTIGFRSFAVFFLRQTASIIVSMTFTNHKSILLNSDWAITWDVLNIGYFFLHPMFD